MRIPRCSRLSSHDFFENSFGILGRTCTLVVEFLEDTCQQAAAASDPPKIVCRDTTNDLLRQEFGHHVAGSRFSDGNKVEKELVRVKRRNDPW